MKRGITLIETIVVVAILGVISLTFSAIFVNAVKIYRQEGAETELISSTQTILDRIVSDTKNSKGVVENYEGYQAGDSVLILELPAVDANENFLYVANNPVYDHIVYYLDGSLLHRRTFPYPGSTRTNEDNVIDRNISNILFTYESSLVGASKVRTEITKTKLIGKVSRSVRLTAKAKMRNQ